MDARRHPEGMNPAEQAVAQQRIAQAKAGNAEAWGELYRQYAPAIFRFCRRAMPTREDAEDATMDIFIKVRQKLSQFDASRPFSAWLYTVAANHCWDLLRRRKLRQERETGEVENMPLEHPDPGQLEKLLEETSEKQVRAALDKLPSRARMALVLRYYSDMSYEEIADSLGVRRAFVGVLLLRARHHLRDALALFHSTGKPLGEIADQLGITHWNLRDWMKQERREGQPAATSIADLQRVIARLQRENESLQAQRDVLKKAMGILSEPNRNASPS